MTRYLWTDGSELYHYGVKGQKWGIRKLKQIFGRRPRSKYDRQKRIERLKKAAKIGAIAAAAGIAAYGSYNLAKDVSTMRDLNHKIKVGQQSIERELALARDLVKSGGITKTNSVTVNYYGNDAKRHQARINYNKASGGNVTGYSYYNMNEGKQQRVGLKEAHNLRVRKRGR